MTEQLNKPRPVVLCIMDGWGQRSERDHNAVALANTPNVDRLTASEPSGFMRASGADVGLPGGQMGFLLLSMLAILILGFFIDFVEISFIIVPILAPVADALGIAPIWFAILIAMNLQASFLTPPFGFALFYLKGVAPESVRTSDIYRGVVPFIWLRRGLLVTILPFPGLCGLP